MSNYRIAVSVELDVVNAESESQARQTAFSLLSAHQSPSKGRPVSGPRASVTGVTIENVTDTSRSLTPIPSSSDAME